MNQIIKSIFQIFILLLLLISNFAFAQTGNAKGELIDYMNLLKTKGVSKFISVTDGCVGCEVRNCAAAKTISDAEGITLLYQSGEDCKMVIFSDFSDYFESDISDCSIFEFIEANIPVFKKQNEYYDSLKPDRFVKPISPHHNYEIISIDTDEIQFTNYMVRDDKGHSKDLRNQDWYKISETIFEKVELLEKTIQE